MRPQRQTTFGGPDVEPADRGNCFATCVAGLFDLDVADVPNFVAYPDWWGELERWCAARGFAPIDLAVKGWDPEERSRWWGHFPGVPFITSGPGPRGHDHSVVYVDGKLSWDPHPTGAGITEVHHVTVFVAREPWRLRYDAPPEARR